MNRFVAVLVLVSLAYTSEILILLLKTFFFENIEEFHLFRLGATKNKISSKKQTNCPKMLIEC